MRGFASAIGLVFVIGSYYFTWVHNPWAAVAFIVASTAINLALRETEK